MLVEDNGTLKIADFAGAAVEGCRFTSSVDYEVGSKLPGETEPSLRSDIFALGSAIYEMMTGKTPYKGRPYNEIQRLFKQHRFPEDFPKDFKAARGLRSIVEMCWGKRSISYTNVYEVLLALNDLGPPSQSTCTINLRRMVPAVVDHNYEPSCQSSDPSSPPSSIGKEAPKRTMARKSKRSSPRRNPYVDSSRNRKKPRQHRSDYGTNWKRKHYRPNHSEGPLTHLVHSFQALLVGKPRKWVY